ncbi:MAG: creatininase family protein [Thermoanaerobaculales bacterium]|nr:creatininase family protein [Thermoanaerobaculales bacterium]
MSWPEVETHLKVSNGVIVPIGSTEQHGPTGLIGTDAICAETLAWRAGELADAIVGPTLTVGMSEHHMRFPGSVTLRPTTLISVVRDVILSLARHGFRRFFFVNGHGGNTASIDAAFFEAYTEAPRFLDDGDEVRCLNGEWWGTPSAHELSVELFGDKDGDHASASEVSIASAAYPDHLKSADLDPEVAPSSHVFGPADFRRRYPEGRMGSHPELASVEAGQRIIEAVAADLADDYRKFLSEE